MGFQGLVCGSNYAVGIALAKEYLDGCLPLTRASAEYDDGLVAGIWLRNPDAEYVPTNWSLKH